MKDAFTSASVQPEPAASGRTSPQGPARCRRRDAPPAPVSAAGSPGAGGQGQDAERAAGQAGAGARRGSRPARGATAPGGLAAVPLPAGKATEPAAAGGPEGPAPPRGAAGRQRLLVPRSPGPRGAPAPAPRPLRKVVPGPGATASRLPLPAPAPPIGPPCAQECEPSLYSRERRPAPAVSRQRRHSCSPLLALPRRDSRDRPRLLVAGSRRPALTSRIALPAGKC